MDRLSRPVDAGSLVVFRIGFGAMMLWELYRYAALGRIARYYAAPAILFPYPGFGWLPRLPAAGFSVLFAALAVAAAAIAAGAYYRVAAWIFFVGYSYTFLIDQSNYQNHLYLFCVLAFLMAITSPHRALSVDAALGRVPRSAVVPAWQPALLAFQIGAVYFWSGVNKLSAEWLSGVPMALNLYEARALAGVGAWLATPAAALLLSWGGMLLDLLCPFLLALKRTRIAASLAVTGFHVANAHLFSIGIFPWFMLFATTLFFSPAWPTRLLRRAFPARPSLDPPPPAAAPAGALRGGGRSSGLAALLGAFVALQIFLPLRHLLGGGARAWDHEGYYFSWTMKLNTRVGWADLRVRLPGEDATRSVHLGALLTRKQIAHLSIVPDMMHTLTRALRPYLPAGADLRWDAFLSVNGRRFRRYVDPDADLSRQAIAFGAKPWILPPPDDPLPSLAEVTAPGFQPEGPVEASDPAE